LIVNHRNGDHNKVGAQGTHKYSKLISSITMKAVESIKSFAEGGKDHLRTGLRESITIKKE
jgi:hypothetical protein